MRCFAIKIKLQPISSKRYSQFNVPPGFCPYEKLGLKRTCSEKEFKSRYLELVMKHHPDKVSSSLTPEEYLRNKERFLEVQRSYEILSIKETRRLWDESAGNKTRANFTTSYAQSASNYANSEDFSRNYSRQETHTEDTLAFYLVMLLCLLGIQIVDSRIRSVKRVLRGRLKSTSRKAQEHFEHR